MLVYYKYFYSMSRELHCYFGLLTKGEGSLLHISVEKVTQYLLTVHFKF